MEDRIKQLITTLLLALGLTMALLSLLGRLAPVSGSGLGDVYCVTPGGGSFAPCSQVFTSIQAAVDAATGGEEIRVAGATYTAVSARPAPAGYPSAPASGIITQVVYISKTVTLRGGYTNTNWTAADPQANPTTLNAQGRGRVLVIVGSISPTVEGLRITGGDATGLGGFQYTIMGNDAGGGVYVQTAAATISNCIVYGNVGSAAPEGLGGGVVIREAAATLTGNEIVTNTATTDVFGMGGGLFVWHSNDVVLRSNTVRGNTASTLGAGQGGGVWLKQSAATLSGNRVVSNTATLSGGLLVTYSAITMTNNLVADNHATMRGSGLYCYGATIRATHTTIANNNGGGAGVLVNPVSTLLFTNTIVFGHDTVAISVTDHATVTLQATLWHNNAADTGGIGTVSTGTINVYDDPAFVDPASWNYHLGIASGAVDVGVGVDAGVAADYDGDPRPVDGDRDGIAAADVGADELVPHYVFLPLVLRGF